MYIFLLNTPLKPIEIDTVLGHVEVSAPMGAGNIYHVMIDKYYNGQIINTARGWQVYLHPSTILDGNDISVILELIEDGTNAI